MGRSTTPAYRVEYEASVSMTSAAYDYKRHGPPSNAVADEIRNKLNESFAPGGVNAHVNADGGLLAHISKLSIVWNKGAMKGDAVAVSTMPMFEVAP